jgi:hypothetical protein
MIPNVTPMISESTNEVPASKSVAGRRSTIAVVTLSEFEVEYPRSPCNTITSQRR